MEQIAPTRYFLGANSVRGFFSLYDSFTDPAAGEFLWVIKGGPGCGKSTFMKKLGAAAEQAGQAVEYIHCSGDPDSLDAVWFPALRTGYVDGTAPHVIVTRVHFTGGMPVRSPGCGTVHIRISSGFLLPVCRSPCLFVRFRSF